MRLLNRPLAFLLAAALGFAAVMVVVEVVALAVGAKPVLFTWTTWAKNGHTTVWNSDFVLTVSIVAIVVGALLLLLELKPARSKRVRLTSDNNATDAAMTRQGLAGAARGAAEDVDGISKAGAASSGRTVTVTARAAASDKSAADALQQPVTDAVTRKLESLGLTRAPRVRVKINPKGA